MNTIAKASIVGIFTRKGEKQFRTLSGKWYPVATTSVVEALPALPCNREGARALREFLVGEGVKVDGELTREEYRQASAYAEMRGLYLTEACYGPWGSPSERVFIRSVSPAPYPHMGGAEYFPRA